MRLLLIVVFAIVVSGLFVPSVHAQALTAQNAVYVEFGGNAPIASFNYEHRFATFFSLRAGAGYLTAPGGDLKISIITIPILAYYMFNFGASNIHIGAGVTIFDAGSSFSFGGANTSGSLTCFTASLGYRLMPRDGGFFFDIGINPIFILGYIAPLPGVGLGWTF